MRPAAAISPTGCACTMSMRGAAGQPVIADRSSIHPQELTPHVHEGGMVADCAISARRCRCGAGRRAPYRQSAGVGRHVTRVEIRKYRILPGALTLVE